ncbi:MAG: glycosyltransferase family 2 protein [Bryobacterales bacterium]|nr:glycosyltransferase family 2 protein [Bryobacterales bacterium]
MPLVTVVVPTLAADDAWKKCLESLEGQTFRDFEALIVDNSERGRVVSGELPGWARVLAPARNVGFGEAINLGARRSQSALIATLNDDAVAEPGWLAAMVESAWAHPQAGMFASQVRLSETELDSAGMLLCADGSSKQRGHLRPPAAFAQSGPTLFPSGSAAMYRRELFDKLGGFEGSYFLYCEDTDLGLRARWAGWDCRYVAEAVVYHRYSYSAGRVSPLKAYLVERNRLFTVLRTFPLRMLLAAPFFSLARYVWHVVSLVTGKGAAGEFRKQGKNPLWLAWFVVKSRLSLIANLPELLAARQAIRRSARVSPREWVDQVRRHAISVREVASL